MEDPGYEKRQRILKELWEEQQGSAITDEEGTYVNLENFRLADHDLSMEDMRVPGNQSLSPAGNRKEGYFLRGYSGGRFRLFKGIETGIGH